MNAVKAGNIAIGTPAGAAATVFPEMGVFLVAYLVSSYDQAYRLLNGEVGDQLDKTFQEKYGVKVLCFFDYGFRHFWNARHAINEPHDLRGLKMRVQPSKVFADTVNGLGGVAVPLGWAEVITAAQQGVIDGADLPVVNMVPLKAYEVSKYFSMTYHNYGPTLMAMNLAVWNDLRPDQQKLVLDGAREAQAMMRKMTESVDYARQARRSMLEPHGMTVNMPTVRRSRSWRRRRSGRNTRSNTASCGTRSSPPGLTTWPHPARGRSVPPRDPEDRRRRPGAARHRGDAGRRVHALRHGADHRLAGRRSDQLLLGRGGGRDHALPG